MISTLLLLIGSNSVYANQDCFLDGVLSDFRVNSSFIAISIKSEDFTGRAVIENFDLYAYVRSQKNLDKEAYKHFVKNLLIGNKELKVNKSELEMKNFYLVRENEEVDQIKFISEEQLIRKYVTGGILNVKLPRETQVALIERLFRLEIGTFRDDVSGNIVVFPRITRPAILTICPVR